MAEERKVKVSEIIELLCGKSYNAWRKYAKSKGKKPKDWGFIREYIKSDDNVLDKESLLIRLRELKRHIEKGDTLKSELKIVFLIDDLKK